MKLSRTKARGVHRRPARWLGEPSRRVWLRAMLPGSMANLAVQALLVVLGLFTGIVTARVLGPVNRGELSFLVLVPSTLTVLGSLGTEYGIYYFWHQEEGKLRASLLATCVMVATVAGALFGLIGFVVVSWCEPGVGLLFRVLVAGSMPLAIANAILTMALMANKRVLPYNASRLAGPVVYASIVCSLWVFGGLTVASAFYGWFASMLATVIADVAMVLGQGSGIPRWNMWVARSAIGYGLRSYVGNVAQYGTLRLDQTILGVLAGNGALGFYYAAVSIGETLLYLASNVGAAMLAQFAGRTKSERRHLAVITMSVAGMGTVLAATLLLVFGKTVIIVLVGRAYVPGLTALRLLLPGLVFMAMAQVMTGYFIAIGEARVFARAALASLAVTVVGDIVLIPAFQATGAALASSLAYGVLAIWLALVFRADGRVPAVQLADASQDTVLA